MLRSADREQPILSLVVCLDFRSPVSCWPQLFRRMPSWYNGYTMPGPTDAGSFPMWPTILGIGGTLIGLIVGFGLNELSFVIRSSREDRRTIGKALAELMEIRQQLSPIVHHLEYHANFFCSGGNILTDLQLLR
jgi:hypothetical protein